MASHVDEQRGYGNPAPELKVAALQGVNPVGAGPKASAAAQVLAAAPADLAGRLTAAENEHRRLRQIMVETKAILNRL